jgi:hypothetical protein
MRCVVSSCVALSNQARSKLACPNRPTLHCQVARTVLFRGGWETWLFFYWATVLEIPPPGCRHQVLEGCHISGNLAEKGTVVGDGYAACTHVAPAATPGSSTFTLESTSNQVAQPGVLQQGTMTCLHSTKVTVCIMQACYNAASVSTYCWTCTQLHSYAGTNSDSRSQKLCLRCPHGGSPAFECRFANGWRLQDAFKSAPWEPLPLFLACSTAWQLAAGGRGPAVNAASTRAAALAAELASASALRALGRLLGRAVCVVHLALAGNVRSISIAARPVVASMQAKADG